MQNISCCECGIVFGVPDEWVMNRVKDGKSFYCPNGHSQYYPNGRKKEEKECKEELDKEELLKISHPYDMKGKI